MVGRQPPQWNTLRYGLGTYRACRRLAGEERAFFDYCLGMWIDEAEKGYTLHDWAEHNPWQAEADARAKKAKNAAKTRWGNTQERPEHQPSNAPLPSPNPNPEEKETLTQSTAEKERELPTTTAVPEENFCGKNYFPDVQSD